MGFDDRLLHTLVVKRMVAVAGGGAETAGGVDTTLTADTAVGALAIEVADVAGIAADGFLRVGGAHTEIRQVETVAALVVVLTAPLALAHSSGDQIRQVADAGIATDDYGQPVMAETTVATVRGLIQPRSAREVALTSQAGAVIGTHVGYMRPLAGLTTRDWIEHGVQRYDIVSVSDAGGIGHHLELGLVAVS